MDLLRLGVAVSVCVVVGCGGGGDDDGAAADAAAGAPDGAAQAPDGAAQAPDAAGPTCSDGVANGDETDVDCGGACDPCATGKACAAGADCAEGVCVALVCEDHHRNCAGILAADASAPDGVYTIDPDGAAGEVAAFDVYCRQTGAGGGWQLVSVVPPGGIHLPAVAPGGGATYVPFLGDERCTDPEAVFCAGNVHPAQVTTDTEVLVADVATGDYLIVDRFSGDANSAIRYFTRERGLDTSDACTAPHMCNDTLTDPDLRIAAHSDYPLEYEPPLVQYWRHGGWYVGAGPAAGANTGNLWKVSYNGENRFSQRATPDGDSAFYSSNTELVLIRFPAP